jgi:hypothetical protein
MKRPPSKRPAYKKNETIKLLLLYRGICLCDYMAKVALDGAAMP